MSRPIELTPHIMRNLIRAAIYRTFDAFEGKIRETMINETSVTSLTTLTISELEPESDQLQFKIQNGRLIFFSFPLRLDYI